MKASREHVETARDIIAQIVTLSLGVFEAKNTIAAMQDIIDLQLTLDRATQQVQKSPELAQGMILFATGMITGALDASAEALDQPPRELWRQVAMNAARNPQP